MLARECVDGIGQLIAEEMKDVLGVAKPGWLMPDGTNAVAESGVLGCWLVDWMKAAGCVDRVGWWVADEMNDVLGGGGGSKTGWLVPDVMKTKDGVGKVAGHLKELMQAEAGVGKVAGQLEELMLAEAGVGKVAGQLEELMLAEAGVSKVAGQLEELMLAEAGVGKVAGQLEELMLEILSRILMSPIRCKDLSPRKEKTNYKYNCFTQAVT